MDEMKLLVAAAGAAYALSAIAYGVDFCRKGGRRRRTGTWFLLTGWLIQSGALGLIVARTGGLPLTSQVLPALCAWVVVVVYLYLEWTEQDRAFGALVVPIAAVLHILAAYQIAFGEGLREVPHNQGWFRIHVLAYILAYAAFAISCVSSILYVMLFGEIHQKHLGFFYERLPPLGILDRITNRAAILGFVFLTGGVAASSVWAYQARYAIGVWAHPGFAPLLAAWVIYAAHLGMRRFAGWQGRRAAYFAIVGFVLVVSVFPVVGFLTSGRHPMSP